MDFSTTGSSAVAPDAGDTFTGTEVIRDWSTGDILNPGNINLVADTGTVGTLQDNEYLIVQGSYSGGVFTVGAGLNTGADSLILYDADGATAVVQQAAIVLVGLTSSEEATLHSSSGVLTWQ